MGSWCIVANYRVIQIVYIIKINNFKERSGQQLYLVNKVANKNANFMWLTTFFVQRSSNLIFLTTLFTQQLYLKDPDAQCSSEDKGVVGFRRAFSRFSKLIRIVIFIIHFSYTPAKVKGPTACKENQPLCFLKQNFKVIFKTMAIQFEKTTITGSVKLQNFVPGERNRKRKRYFIVLAVQLTFSVIAVVAFISVVVVSVAINIVVTVFRRCCRYDVA